MDISCDSGRNGGRLGDGAQDVGTGVSWTLRALTAVAMIASLAALSAALSAAMSRLPLGIACPVWTGIGSVGSVAPGVMAFGQQLSASGIPGVTFLLVGMLMPGAEAH